MNVYALGNCPDGKIRVYTAPRGHIHLSIMDFDHLGSLPDETGTDRNNHHCVRARLEIKVGAVSEKAWI